MGVNDSSKEGLYTAPHCRALYLYGVGKCQPLVFPREPEQKAPGRRFCARVSPSVLRESLGKVRVCVLAAAQTRAPATHFHCAAQIKSW
jgi:hypothetical protein